MSAQDVDPARQCVQPARRPARSGPPLGAHRDDARCAGTVAKEQQTTGGGRWGIIDGLPKEIVAKQGPVSIKNGWTPLVYDGNWHISCLAISEDWVLAVQTRYPSSKGL